MALITCKGCGHRISTHAKVCVKCGAGNTAIPAETGKSPNRPDRVAPAAARPVPGRPEPLPRPTPPTGGRDMAPEPRSADTPSGDADHTEASEPQVDYKEGAEQWFYVSAAGRQGPIDRDLLRSHAANGEIAPDSLVWKSGLPDWIKFSELDRLPTPTVPNDPFPVPAPRSNVYPWALSLAPLWGTAIQIMATDSRLAATHEKLANYSEMWWIVALLNILVAYLDLARFNKNDRHGEKIAKWWCLAVPFYIYRRDRIADAGMTRFWTWIGSLALALGILQFLNKIYAHQIIG